LELTKPGKHDELIKKAITSANWMFAKQSDATLEELAVELMVELTLRPERFGAAH
jgi:hypothetical protein